MAKIKIDLDRRLGTVDPRIYGGFIEHLGRCIYGGIFEEGSTLSDEHGFRLDVLEAMKTLHPPVLRWPGGNFVSGYHWLDGVGPVEQRPRRMELAWHAEESNRFGTNEFLQYCQRIGAEPYICVNMGSGTLDEAQSWVEYCNGTGNTYWANLRREHGHPEPYKVKYWGLGNEMYGSWQIGALNAEDYIKKAREFAKVMKWTDPSIQLASCGQFGWNEWDAKVIDALAPHVDFHSIHLYTGSHDYYSNIFAPHMAERALRNTHQLIELTRFRQKIKHPISVVYDEWNIWFREHDNILEERYNLADALAFATYLNIFIRGCTMVHMANLAQMVNVIAPIFTSKEGLFLQTIYHPFKLYNDYMQGSALDVCVEGERYTRLEEHETSFWDHRVADMGPFQLLDVAATYDESNSQVAIAVVNRDQERALTSAIQLTDERRFQSGIEVYEINGAGPEVENSFEQPDAVTLQRRTLDLSGQRFEYTFPAHSITLLRGQLA